MTASITSPEAALREAAITAVLAPSIFNTQPWRWQNYHGVLRLWADHDRQLLVADPDGRMLTISCGVGLHHAQVALTAAGYAIDVQHLPDPADPDVLAEIRILQRRTPSREEIRLHAAIARRHTDRRTFTSELVNLAQQSALIAAAETVGAHLHLIRADQIADLSAAATEAAAVQLANAGYRRELIRWTHRPEWNADGIPVTTAVEQIPRAVPVRDFAPFGGPVMTAGTGTDNSALYAVVFTDADEPLDWLHAGIALSAVLLTATDLGLGTAPISDITELAVTRQRLRQLLSGIGMPQIAVRIGHPAPGTPPATPRRRSEEVIYP